MLRYAKTKWKSTFSRGGRLQARYWMAQNVIAPKFSETLSCHYENVTYNSATLLIDYVKDVPVWRRFDKITM